MAGKKTEAGSAKNNMSFGKSLSGPREFVQKCSGIQGALGTIRS
jgi:hypothetical protein